ncbi:NADPH oxidase 5-like [Daphnia pulex]|uniref:NADPH oxidase 5-like n=1 Tax=Daphnia pulex TaxID=6669 RepID=UPI001EDD181A|nr:NADPH oxidase 5-like [Daphnia pulex]
MADADPSKVGSIHPNEKALLSKSNAPSYDAMEVADVLYPALHPEDSGKRNWLSQAQQRTQALASLESLCNSYCVKEHKSAFSPDSFCQLFSQENVLQVLFSLFDHQCKGQLVLSDFIESLKEKLGAEGTEFVDLLDTLWYVFTNETDADLETFCRIFKSKGVLIKLYALIDKNKAGQVSVNQVMAFFTECTSQNEYRGSDICDPRRAEALFRSIAKDDSQMLEFEDFKKLIPSKNPFFAKRVFCIFDKSGSNSISMAEFREGMQQFCGKSEEDKVRCLFQIYDEDGDGIIKLSELKAVLKACVEENGMKFSEMQLDELTIALYDDARDSSDDVNRASAKGLSFDELKTQMTKHPGLLENLSISLDRLLQPNAEKKIQSQSVFQSFSSYAKNNVPFIMFVLAYAIVNIGLIVSRGIQYQKENVFYILARCGGQALNFNCAFILVLMLRHCITLLRQIGCGYFLPLDLHVYLHKVCGGVVVVLSAVHTLMHLINFPLNIADKVESPVTKETHSAIEWLFTTEPGLFGLIPGWANLTGWALVGILIIMGLCSLPCVRKSGSFEVFYWTHLLYIPFWVLLILHGPNFWYWFIGPGILFFIEGTGRFRLRVTGKGRTFISSALLLPSRVTHLVIRKPENFNFNPGDYVFVKIPAITASEWHPFTISSAPELPDVMWLHIRCAGGWTNKLYDYFEREQAKLCLKQSAQNQQHNGGGEPACRHCQRILENDASFSTQNIMKGVRRLTRTFSNKNPVDKYDQLESCRMTLRPLKNSDQLNGAHDDPSSSITFNRAQSPARQRDQYDEGILRDKQHHRYPHHHQQPRAMSILVPIEETPGKSKTGSEVRKRATPRASYAPESMRKKPAQFTSRNENRSAQPNSEKPHSVEGVHIYYPLEIAIDGPYGTPSSHIFRAQHAVLVAAGIGVTPFASILQSIMHRYYVSRQSCPRCHHSWVSQMPDTIMNLKKVDFFWINREQRSFEWFVEVLSQLEMEQAEMGSALGRFLDLHMYITSALKKTDLKAVGLQMALDLIHAKDKRDLVTGLKTRTNAGRPNWDKIFQKLVDEDKGKVTVFYCGPPQLAKELRKKCNEFGFGFSKEIF